MDKPTSENQAIGVLDMGASAIRLVVAEIDAKRTVRVLEEADRERLLLQVGALLHDIGIFVSVRAHHKHSLYILSASQIFGLSNEETAVVANIARWGCAVWHVTNEREREAPVAVCGGSRRGRL